MNPYREVLLGMLARLDQMSHDAHIVFTTPMDTELGEMCEQLRQLLADMQTKVEQRLEQIAD